MGLLMRTPKYLSPTSVNLWLSNRDEFYLKYLSDHPLPSMPQTIQMAIGSGFDARIKSYLAQYVFGKVDHRFDLVTLFEQQVEEQHREKVWDISKYIFDCYKHHGALADLMIELKDASTEPQFEFKIEGRLKHEAVIGDGVPILGIPDVYFRNKQNTLIIYDWKVNQYFAKQNVSPKSGYIKLLDGWETQKHTRQHGKHHKDAVLMMVDNIIINIAQKLEDIDSQWATQLAMYAMVLDNLEDFIAGIDQITSTGQTNEDNYPLLRISRYRNYIGADFKTNLINTLVDIWTRITTGQIFDEDNENKITMLDDYHKAFEAGSDPNDQWFVKMMRES